MLRLICDIRIVLAASLLTFCAWPSTIAAETRTFEAKSAELISGASKVNDTAASGGSLVALAEPGQGVKFAGLPAASKLAIRYASVKVGTISVAVNDQPARKVNVHSSGALTNSFLHAIIDLAIPANATLTISLATNDVAVNIDRSSSATATWGCRRTSGTCRRCRWPPVLIPPTGRRSASFTSHAGVVARREVRRVGALGPAIHARGWRLVCARHVSGGQRRNIITSPTFRPSVGLWLQGHRPQLGD